MIAASDDQPRDDDHGRPVDQGVWHRTHGDAMQLLHIVLRPDLGAQQAQAHLHQSVVQVNQHYVVTPGGDGVIEGDRPDLRVGVAQTLKAARPRAHSGHLNTVPAGASAKAKGSSGGRPANTRPVLTAIRMFAARWKSRYVVRSSVQLGDAVFQFTLGAHEAAGLGNLLASARRVSRSLSEPSISPDICGAMTGLTLPMSARMDSSLRSARMMSSP